MEQYKYTLDKSSRKHICPNCNKRTFVLYVDNEANNYLPDDFGKCDRSTNCNYHKAPLKGKKAFNIPFLLLKSISDKAHKLTDLNGIITIVPTSQILEQTKNDCWITEWFLKNSLIQYLSNKSKYFKPDEISFINVAIIKESPPEHVPSFHSLELVQKSFLNCSQNNFVAFLQTFFDTVEVKEAVNKYLIATSKHYPGATIFWQIDDLEQVHAGKILQYNLETGKRVKDLEGKSLINWVHSVSKLKDYNLKQCLFGLHLIKERNSGTIAIVEAEKTAVVMSLFKPEYTWMSTGSKQGFKYEMLLPIKQYKIIAFPDKSEFNDWHKKANDLNNQGFNISVSDLIENTNYPTGTDLADIYIDLKKHN
jgi:hypothetical protein